MTDHQGIIADYVERGWVPFAYAAENALPLRWQDSEIHEGTVRECVAALDEGSPVGIVLGKRSGIVVVDIDVTHGGSLEAVMQRYTKEAVTTYGVSTASGGYHLYFTYPDGVENLPKRINAGKWIDGLGPGIDLLADGHHVIAPPTIRSNHPTKQAGKYRKLTGNYSVAPMPAALLADWLESLDTKHAPQGEVVDQIPDADHSWVLDLHRANVQAAAESVVGERDITVYQRLVSSVRLAHYLPDDVLTVTQVETDFVSAYEAAQGDEILDIDGKINRAIRYAEAHPWVVVDADKALLLPDGVSPEQAGDFMQRVAQRKLDKLISREANRQLADIDAAEIELPPMLSGDALLKAAEAAPDWAVDGLLAPGHSVILTAQKKSGKTTLILNLIHALTTGQPFLGQYRPMRPMRVAYLDMELGQGTATAYAQQLGIPLDQMDYVDLKGKARYLDCRNDKIRSMWVRRLLAADIDAVVIDPVGPIVSALAVSENDNGEVRRLLDSFDTLTREAGCLLGPIVAHHAGHEAKGRGRGAAAFGDWPSVEWNLVRPRRDDGSPIEGSAYQFSIQSNRATGSGLHGPRELDYEPGTRRTWYGERSKPMDPKRARYEEFVGGTAGSITVKDVQTAVPGIGDRTAKAWLDSDPLLTVTAEGGRGIGPRTWARRGGDPFSTAPQQ